MVPLSCRITLAAAVILAAACSSTESPTAPDLAKVGTSGSQFAATPTAVEFDWPPGGSQVITVTVQYLTTVTASSSNTGCATVSPASTPTRKPKGSSAYVATFTVVAAGEGTCAIRLADKNGKSTTVQVRVLPPLPDRIVYTSDRDGGSDIFVMDLDGSHPTQLTATADQYDIFPVLSPNGRRILFYSVVGDISTLTLMGVDGTGRVALPLPANAKVSTFSPDGKRLAYSALVDSWTRIFTSDLTGANPVQLTSGSDFPSEADPSWSGALPGRIAFVREAPRTIWIMNADGSGQLQLMPDNDPLFHQLPSVALSPDGEWVAFSCQPLAHVDDICSIKADGTGTAQVLTDAVGDDRNPRWTRDGRIVFTSERDGNQEIYVMNADGTGQTNLTNSPANESSVGPLF